MARRRLWRVVRAVLYMLRRGLPSGGKKLSLDLHLLLHRGKIAGKALGELFLALHHGRHAGSSSSFSCRALDPSLAVHEPALRARREVEFSCSNTPSSASAGDGGGLGLLSRRIRRSRREPAAGISGGGGGYYYQQQYCCYDAAEVARVFELLNDDDADSEEPSGASASATPSPAQLLYWAAAAAGPYAGRHQAAPRGGVAAGSSSSPDVGGAQVDRQADEFIRRFYEQLRAQRSAASTPDCYGHAAATPRAAPWPVAAGIA